jgi:hypothetical protein
MPMQQHMPLDIASVFPISDRQSARLMRYKARCLRRAGVLSAQEETAVMQRAEGYLVSIQPSQLPRLPERMIWA